MRVWWVLAALGCVGCNRGATPVAAVPDRSGGAIPALRAQRVANGVVRVDGRLDEAVWRTTGTTAGFVHPSTGKADPHSGVQAAAWIAWDDDHVYLAARVAERDPHSPFHPWEVDPHLWERASAVEWMIQPGDPGDNRQYLELQVDVADARWTTWFDDYNEPITASPDGQRRFGHQEWSPTLRTGVQVDRDHGVYTLEVGLAWRDIPAARVPVPPREGAVWRMNVYSFREGQRDALAWSPLLGEGNFHRAARFGRVTFVGAR